MKPHFCSKKIRSTMSGNQSAEYDKRVANISLFIYIGSQGLHPNSRQAPRSSHQSLSLTHTYIYIHICWAARRLIYIYQVASGKSQRYITYVIYIYSPFEVASEGGRQANFGDGRQISLTV